AYLLRKYAAAGQEVSVSTIYGRDVVSTKRQVGFCNACLTADQCHGSTKIDISVLELNRACRDTGSWSIRYDRSGIGCRSLHESQLRSTWEYCRRTGRDHCGCRIFVNNLGHSRRYACVEISISLIGSLNRVAADCQR